MSDCLFSEILLRIESTDPMHVFISSESFRVLDLTRDRRQNRILCNSVPVIQCFHGTWSRNYANHIKEHTDI